MRRILLSILVLFALCAGFSGVANATTCSVAGGGGSGPGDDCYWTGAVNSAWTTSGNWSDSPGSGGTPGASCACTPAVGANIHIGGSASNSNANLNMGGARTFGDWDGGSYIGALTWGSTTQTTNKVGAAIVFGTGMTLPGIDNTSILSFAAASGTSTLDGGGIAAPMPGITVGAGVTVNLTGHAYNGGSTDTLTVSAAGAAFNQNGQNLTMGHFTGGNNANTRSLTCGTGTTTITATDGGTIFDARGSNITVACNAGGILAFNPTNNLVTTIFFDNSTYGNVHFNDSGIAAFIQLNAGAPTFGTISAGPWTAISLAISVTMTGNSTWAGTAAKPITISGWGAARTITATGGSLTCTYCYASWITKSGGTLTFNSSFDGGHNTGLTITPPSGGNSLVGL